VPHTPQDDTCTLAPDQRVAVLAGGQKGLRGERREEGGCEIWDSRLIKISFLPGMRAAHYELFLSIEG
jgi:hypothetical protein